MKKLIIIEICIVLLITVAFVSYNFTENCNEDKYEKDINNNIKVTMSSKIEKVDFEKHSELSALYNIYPYKNYYEFYYCTAKVENNSEFYIYDIYLSPGYSGNKWVLDYESDCTENCYIEPDTTEYIGLLITVDKTIGEEELEEIPEQLPGIVRISADKKDGSAEIEDYTFFDEPLYYELTDEDYSANELTFSIGFI